MGVRKKRTPTLYAAFNAKGKFLAAFRSKRDAQEMVRLVAWHDGKGCVVQYIPMKLELP